MIHDRAAEARRIRRPALCFTLLLAVAALGPSGGAEGETTALWRYPVSGQGDVQMDLPSSWKEAGRDEKAGVVRFRPGGGVKAELTLAVSWSGTADPDFSGSSRLQDQVFKRGQEFLDQAVEARVTLRELRGPQAAGYYWTLRDRAPGKKWALYVTRGMVGAGRALLDFTLVTSRSDPPEIRQALKMLAGARQGEPAAESPAGP
jgi:hypothetical protein